MKNNTRKILNTILIILIIICSYKILYKYFQYYKDSKNYSQIRAIKYVHEPAKEAAKVSAYEEKSTATKLSGINSDYKLWINVPNTAIDYPVVQGKNNDFYLHNNFYKSKSLAGAVFIDYRNKLASDKNVIIYGHNMKDGSMFSQLDEFKSENNFNKGVIRILENNTEYTYEIFSVFVEGEENNDLKINFVSEEDYINYIKYLRKKSIYNRNTEVNNYNKIITLYTCSYEFNGARTIVCAGLKRY